MGNITRYLVAVTAGAALCAVIRRLAGVSAGNQKIIHLITGVFLALAVISPLKYVDLDMLPTIGEDFRLEAEHAAAMGEAASREQMCAIIKEETQAYILDKALDLNAQIQVEVFVSEEDIPVLRGVTVKGNISPYAKKRLMSILEKDLGLSEEAQTWI